MKGRKWEFSVILTIGYTVNKYVFLMAIYIEISMYLHRNNYVIIIEIYSKAISRII